MALQPGTRIGAYEIAGALGAGGMGEVYRATDTNLGRQVAIKVLPEAFAHHPDRLARFEREAKTLASLNHPNIAQIHGLEKSDGFSALVMELVEGPTLADRIAQGAIPIDDALPIAKQIAEALEAAHEQGIVHRDLKPANIKVHPDGTVKVLDFGLAKAMEPAGTMSPSVSQSPTITSPALMTGVGMILGTAAYMSPEQARGKVVNKRTDIWAFGAVLFEMLTGKRAFGGDDVSEVLSRVLQREPDFDTLPPVVPSRVSQVLRVCLRKDMKQRAHDMADVRLALEGAFEATAPQLVRPARGSSRGARLAWVVATAAVIAAAVLAIPTVQDVRETPTRPQGERPVLRFTVSPPDQWDVKVTLTDGGGSSAPLAVSPDGRRLAFVATGPGGTDQVWVRAFDTLEAQMLPGTEGAASPFWSPESQHLGFFASGKLKRIDVSGGPPLTLCDAPNARGGTWSQRGVIVFAPSNSGALQQVSAAGGVPTSATRLPAGETSHLRPWFLPDGQHFLYTVRPGGVYVASLDSTDRTLLLHASDSTNVLYTQGHLLFLRGTTLMAQPFDVERLALASEAVPIAEDIRTQATLPVGYFAAAATGVVAYQTGASGSQRQLTWVDRSGTARGTIGGPDSNSLQSPRVSPDGRRVVVARTVQANQDLWLLDGTRTNRFTFDAASDTFPLWSPDGTRIVFRSLRTGGDLYEKLTSGSGVEEQLVASDQGKSPGSWSADGRFLLYHSIDLQTDYDLWVVPMVGDRTPTVFLKTPFREGNGAFSPDGRWVAYQSNESGRPEIYVRAFVPPRAAGTAAAATGGQWQVSTAGGTFPAWRPDGKELYYLSPAGAMMAAPISVSETSLEPGAPVTLFSTRIASADTQQSRQYDVAPDGRFLINAELDSADTPITLLMNWNPEAKK